MWMLLSTGQEKCGNRTFERKEKTGETEVAGRAASVAPSRLKKVKVSGFAVTLPALDAV